VETDFMILVAGDTKTDGRVELQGTIRLLPVRWSSDAPKRSMDGSHACPDHGLQSGGLGLRCGFPVLGAGLHPHDFRADGNRVYTISALCPYPMSMSLSPGFGYSAKAGSKVGIGR